MHLDNRCADDKPFVPTFQVSKERTRSLGIEYIPFEVSLKEIVESLKEKKFSNQSQVMAINHGNAPLSPMANMFPSQFE
ncbi:hypothetical protein CFP56_016102 [Quercus suber]|uniref:Uncharacterized protein n=1 Tax=Quercus suber TaxID=58331 RepID=A0AAW0KMU7_QUESU